MTCLFLPHLRRRAAASACLTLSLSMLLLTACGGGTEPTVPDTTTGAAGTDVPQSQAVTTTALKLPLSAKQLLEFSSDWTKSHEAAPQGVPLWFDWARQGRVGAGNTVPAGFSAMTGWAQSFWIQGTSTVVDTLSVRGHQTLVCAGPDRTWTLVQGGDITGATFYPDYSNNTAVPPLSFTQSGGVASLSYPVAMAYHFWPASGRVALPAGPLCGVLVLVEAKATRAPGVPPASNGKSNLLIGLGGDYWLSTAAPWSGYDTNADIGIGRLKFVGPDWKWYGMTTASSTDLRRLAADGYTVATR